MVDAMASTQQPDDALERLGSADAGEVLTLQRAAYVTEAQAHDDLWMPPLTQSLDDLRGELDRGALHAWGFREHRRLVAAVRVEVHGDLARLGRLVVAPDRQGRGWGTRLLRATEHELIDTVAAIELFTGEHSSANLRLYRRAGYSETGRSAAGAYDLVQLRKNLRAPGPREGSR